MSEFVRFELADPWLIVAATLAFVILMAVILRERRLGWPSWRTWVWALALLSLWLLFAGLRVPGAVRPTEAVLLTDGADPIDPSLERENDPGLRFSLATDPRPGYQAIPDASFLARDHPEIEELEIVGDGLDPWELERLPFGVRSTTPARGSYLWAQWPRTIALGQELELRIRLEGDEPPAAVRLIGPTGDGPGVDLTGRSKAVRLEVRPKRAGRHLYRLELLDTRNQVVSAEPVGVSVVEPPRRRILWLQASPTFEVRHVKNWLAESGSELTVRTRLSRDRFRTEFVNADSARFGGLRRDSLAGFDLVILDRRTLVAMGKSERTQLLTAVAEDSVGVLALLPGGDVGGLGGPFGGLDVAAIRDVDELSARLRWAGKSLEPALRIAAREIRAGGASQPIVRDSAGRVLASKISLGRGFIGVSLLSDTHRWVLEGESMAFHSLWSRLIEELARADNSEFWRLPDEPILVDRPLEVGLHVPARRLALPRVKLEDSIGSVSVAVRQDVVDPNRWTLRLWPRVSGWHRLRADDGADTWFHVADRDQWARWIRGERRDATRAAGELRATGRSALERRWKRASPVLPFALLLAALGVLWTEERRRRPSDVLGDALDGSGVSP
ncbi:MAG: hypothetical protein ACE5GX_07900 [Thermoanaerobaculia bacterium]